MNKAVLLVAFILMLSALKAQSTFKRSLKLMGSGFDITVLAKDSIAANTYINLAVNEIVRIEKLISSWDPNSQTSAINKNAGILPTKVDKELFDLIDRAVRISKLTDGAFDISYASMDKIWRFDGTMTVMPTANELRASVAKVGFNHIILDKEKQTVFLGLKGMKIGFGAIGKGYAADMAKALLIKKGASSGIINASGDMSAWGKPSTNKEWKVAITNPMDKDKAFAVLPITDGAVITSGNYEKFVNFNGKRYSHIIDPRTGIPSSGILSATVFGPKAEIADALGTAIFVMGIEVGINRINQLPNIECVIVDEKGNLHTSSNIKIDKI